jgi:hypothetical protein
LLPPHKKVRTDSSSSSSSSSSGNKQMMKINNPNIRLLVGKKYIKKNELTLDIAVRLLQSRKDISLWGTFTVEVETLEGKLFHAKFCCVSELKKVHVY